ncbi:MAG: hypothetical protein ACRDD7_12875 [Peptostreptococcaceae bacterium]
MEINKETLKYHWTVADNTILYVHVDGEDMATNCTNCKHHRPYAIDIEGVKCMLHKCMVSKETVCKDYDNGTGG